MGILINPLILMQLTPSGIFAVPHQITKLVGHLFGNTDLVVMEIGQILFIILRV